MKTDFTLIHGKKLFKKKKKSEYFLLKIKYKLSNYPDYKSYKHSVIVVECQPYFITNDEQPVYIFPLL